MTLILKPVYSILMQGSDKSSFFLLKCSWPTFSNSAANFKWPYFANSKTFCPNFLNFLFNDNKTTNDYNLNINTL